jgi:hypothetical protein
MQKLKILTGQQESDDYPYGRLRCHITFDLEFKAKKGFRFVTQTTNPKTGKVNKPKKSTYSAFMCLYMDENGHIKCHSMNVRGYEDIKQMIEFLTIHDVSFTSEQSEHLWIEAISCIRGNARYTRIQDGKVRNFLDALGTGEMIKKYGEKADFNQIKHVGFDLELAKSFKEA